MFNKAFLVLVFLFPLSVVNANGIDFRLSSDTAELTFLSEASTFGYGGADIGFGGIVDDNSNFLIHASILVSGSGAADIQALQFGVGVKAYAGSIDLGPTDETGGALAIGAKGRYVFPGPTPLAVLVEAYIAPSVASFGDFDGVTEVRAGLEMEVTPSARAYVGYRILDIDTNVISGIELDDSIHFGVRFSY